VLDLLVNNGLIYRAASSNSQNYFVASALVFPARFAYDN